MNETRSKPQCLIDNDLERLQRETAAILEASAALVKEMEGLMETSRQLQAAQAALIEQRRKNKKP